MALTNWLTSTAALQRQSNTVDAGGAPVSSPFTTITSGLSCAVYPVGSAMASIYQQYAIKGDYVVLFAADPSAKPGDRLSVGGVYYLVNGLLPFANPRPGGTSVYVVDASLTTKS